MKFFFWRQKSECIWASTANWRGGPGKNVEIDILQENRNCDIKKEIKVMGANKTDKADKAELLEAWDKESKTLTIR